jgi:hypothetical protein
MTIQSYLQPANKGNQLWQMLRSNLTRGAHPYNFSGFCIALVGQWLLEIKFAAGATPDELGRYLLKNNIGTHGYGGIGSSQEIYGAHNPNMNIHSAMFDRHSGGALTRGNAVNVQSHEDHWRAIRAGIYNVPNDDTIRLNDHGRVYSAHISLTGGNSWLLKLLGAGNIWGHAIGLHSDGNRVYFFDPNYGIFIFNQEVQGTMATFIRELWGQYGASGGRVAQVT